MSAAAEARQITGGEWETRVTEAGYAGEMAERRSLWWAGVPGLDPLHPARDPSYGAQTAAMACAAHVLGADVTRTTRFRGGASPVASDFYRWLTGHNGELDAYLRRLALRLASDIPGLPADDVLAGAQALHAAIAGR
jgi:hypothetical protein